MVGNGKLVQFWLDWWVSDGLLIQVEVSAVPPLLQLQCRVRDLVLDSKE